MDNITRRTGATQRAHIEPEFNDSGNRNIVVVRKISMPYSSGSTKHFKRLYAHIGQVEKIT